MKYKIIDIAATVSMVFALTFCAFLLSAPSTASATQSTVMQYESALFGQDIITVDISVDQATWDEMLNNATNEEYISADITINGTKFSNVGIRPKGNSSLTQVAGDDTTDRFSFRLNFDKYIDGQTCFGLDELVLNNMHSDFTYMKEYLCYDIMNYIGVNTPKFGYANITLNGEQWGLYLALEMYDQSYETRVYSDASGMLYNVKSMDAGGGGGGGGTKPSGAPPPSFSESTAESTEESTTESTEESTEESSLEAGAESRREGMGGKMMGGSTGGSLEYTDDLVSSYSAIFDNAVTTGTDADYSRVITALKALAQGDEIEKYFNVDQILRYLAAHTVVVNLDSYSSNMAQNYYIYEADGQITILPWDYNLAWGGFSSNDATSVINFPIDTPVSGVEFEARPLISVLFSNPEYLKTYHSYLEQIVNGYFANGNFEVKVNKLDALISSYVKTDPTAFCTFEQYQASLKTLLNLASLRASSITGQLNGTIPSTTQGQQDSDALISGEGINLTDLGSSGGMGGRGGSGGSSGMGGRPDGSSRPANLPALPDSSNNTNTANFTVNYTLIALGFSLIVAIIIATRFKRRY